MRGVRPHDLNPELFNKLTNNDIDLARVYAFDKYLLKNSGCSVDYGQIKYTVRGFDIRDIKNPITVRIENEFIFNLKLSRLLSGLFDVSAGEINDYADKMLIKTSPDFDVMRYRIKTDFDLHLNLNGNM